jgi:iron complex outermembrane recepter protein
MKQNRRILSLAVAQCLATTCAISLTVPQAFAQTSADLAAQKVEKIEVTGSNIKRVDAETVAPVQVITREDIERSGKLTIAEVIRELPTNNNSFNETFTNSFSPGSSGVSMRGLGMKATLVLINGRRMANYGFAQNLQDTFVDLNSIPTSAIERVEILMDGASAIYGADAIGGVVNIILRKDYKGVQLSASGGTGSEKGMNEYRASITAGFGDLGRDRFNVLGVLDFYSRDLLLRSERKWTASGDTSEFPGGSLQGWTAGAATLVTGTINGTTGRMAIAPNCPPGTVRRAATDFDRRRVGQFVCARNTADLQTLFPESDRVGFLGRGTFDISERLTAFAEVMYSKNKSFQTFTPTFVPSTQVNQVNGQSLTTSVVLPVGHINNSDSVARQLQYTFFELGGRNSDIETDAHRALAGIKGSAGTWDWEASVGTAESETKNINYNRINRFLVTPAFVASYNFASPDLAQAAALRITPVRVAKSKLKAVDFKTSSELMQLPAGPLGFATGFEYRRESLQDRPDAFIASGSVMGQGGTETDGSRNNKAWFGELSVPLLKNVEAQLALRRDDYSDFGSKTSPKVGVKWTVTPQFLLRATSSRGFRAPTLPEVAPSRATAFTGVFDPVLGVPIPSVAATIESNPTLKAETSQSHNFGIVFEPSKNFNVGLDYYNIRINDTIQIPGQFIVNRAAAGDPRYVNRVIRDAGGNIVAIIVEYVNLDFIETSGIELDTNYSFSALGGKFTLGARYAYIIKFNQVDGPGGPVANAVDTNADLIIGSSYPRYKGSVSATFRKGAWLTSATYRYVHSTDQVVLFSPPLREGGTAPQARVGAHFDVDLFLSYEGIKNLKLTGSVRNALNKRPPYDPSFSSGIDFTQFDARGRFFTVGATYTFK